MTQIRIGAQINNVKDPTGKQGLRATLPLRALTENQIGFDDISNYRRALEEEYLNLIYQLKEIVKQIRSGAGRGRVLLYWNLGDKVLHFEEANHKRQVFLENLVKHLIRDVGISEKTINRCRKFRKLYPDISSIDPDRTFDSYVTTFEGGYISKARKDGRRIRAE